MCKSESWQLGDTLNYSDIGVREENSINELTGFKLIKGKGLVGANLSTLRMAANFYNTPCPVDVIEKILESAEERAGSIPIQGMGQLAESMGLQTQIGDVPLKKLKELEFPVLFQEDKYFSLIANADGNMLKIADLKGWRNIVMQNYKKSLAIHKSSSTATIGHTSKALDGHGSHLF